MAKWIDNKTVILTGASSGIGKMLAERLMKEHNCKVIGVIRPIYASGDEKEPLSLTLENVEITPRKGSEGINFIETKNCNFIRLDKVKLNGFSTPQILACTETELQSVNSTATKLTYVSEIEDYDC